MADVTIRGAGIFGLSIAWACARRGARVQLIDPFGAGSGASGGLVGALAPHVPENWNVKKAFQLESLLAAEEFWRSVERAGGCSSGYGRTGRLQPIADDAAMKLAEARGKGAERLWQGRAVWQIRNCKDFENWCPPSASKRVIFDSLSARIHPRQACTSLVSALRTLGVHVVSEADDAGAVVHASGSHGLVQLNAEFNKPVGTSIKGQAALLQHDAGVEAPQLFAESLHFVPHADGTTAIGSTSEREFDDASSTDAQLDVLVERARHIVPALREAKLVKSWAGLRPRSRSRAPILGAHPLRPGHYIANGGFKIGFGMAPKISEVMADLVLEQKDAVPDAFRIEASL